MFYTSNQTENIDQISTEYWNIGTSRFTAPVPHDHQRQHELLNPTCKSI